MSVLAQNIRTIRKELKCTQSAMADILKVGFRTYVRYEAGERDAPVSTLVKLARLGNLSLEQLLTQKITGDQICPIEGESLSVEPPQVKSANFKTGHIIFRQPSRESLLTIDESEKKILSLFRRMSSEDQALYLKTIESHFKPGGASSKSLRAKVAKSMPPSTIDEELAVVPVQEKNTRTRKRGRPGKTRQDKKILREKIDRLKRITREIPKITVR